MESKDLVSSIREKHRTDTYRLQSDQRTKSMDRKRCGLFEIESHIKEHEQLTEEDIKKLSARIKRRKHAIKKDLLTLNAAFLHTSENISVFCKITGALNIIVKEFTGTDTEIQLLAAECLCNIALGDDVCSKKIIQLSGSYLVTYLDNVSNKDLLITCLWTIQNLILSGEKLRSSLAELNVPEKLLSLVENVTDDEVLFTVEETLLMLIIEGWTEFNEKIKRRIPAILCNLCKIESINTLNAFYVILLEDSHLIEVKILEKLVKIAIENLIEITKTKNSEYTKCILSIRILTIAILHSTSMDLKPISSTIISILLNSSISLSNIANQIISMKNETVIKELLWMLSSVYETSKTDINFKEYVNVTDDIASKLLLPVEYI